MAGRQRGVVLMVVLVILLAVTLLGTVVMQGASLQARMVGNSQARQQAFNSAEATLATAEQWLASNTTFNSSNLSTRFTSGCTDGLCFSGAQSITTGLTAQSSCLLAASEREVWEDTALKVWATDGKHRTASVPNMDHDGKYIIEFRCFIDGAGTAKVITSEGDAFFRITAQGYSQDGESTVMVQSTYRLHLD